MPRGKSYDIQLELRFKVGLSLAVCSTFSNSLSFWLSSFFSSMMVVRAMESWLLASLKCTSYSRAYPFEISMEASVLFLALSHSTSLGKVSFSSLLVKAWDFCTVKCLDSSSFKSWKAWSFHSSTTCVAWVTCL